MDCYYLSRNKENAIWKGINDRPFTNIAIQVPNVTQFHVRWTKEENVGMYVEFGLEQTNGGTEGGLIDGVNLRHAFRLVGYHADLSDPCRTHQHSHFTPHAVSDDRHKIGKSEYQSNFFPELTTCERWIIRSIRISAPME